MAKLSRRQFTALAGVATVGAAVPLRRANAAQFSFKLGTNVPESHPLNVYARKAAKEQTYSSLSQKSRTRVSCKPKFGRI